MHRMEDTEGSSVPSPPSSGPGHQHTGALNQWGGHTLELCVSVFHFFPPPTSGTTLFFFLLHPISLLSTHNAFESARPPPPRVASDFGGCYTPCFLTCFSCQLCDLPSPKALSKLIQLPYYNQKAQVSPTVWAYRVVSYRAVHQRA